MLNVYMNAGYLMTWSNQSMYTFIYNIRSSRVENRLTKR